MSKPTSSFGVPGNVPRAGHMRRAGQVPNNGTLLETHRWWIVGTLLLVVAGLGWYFFSEQEVRLSENGYELSKALYAACNLEDTNRLNAFENTLPRYELSAQERAEMIPILDLAKEGQWRDAAIRARALLESQELP